MIKKIFFSYMMFATIAFAADPVVNAPKLKLTEPLPANLFIELAKAVDPAVVRISTSALPSKSRRDPMEQFLEELYGSVPGAPRRSNRPQELGLGTGFVIREDGLIVTNAHVVQGADIINVQFAEKGEKVYEAKLVGSDVRSDIALLKITATGKLPYVFLGSSKEMQKGEWVAAIGNPFGHDHTISKGIISYIGRGVEEINKFPLLQTDCSINPGNSGGPLVNTKGQVIGVNSAIDGRAQGIGFAIPIDEVKKILPELESRGSVRKGYIGIGLGDLDPTAAENLGTKGAVVLSVERGAPAALAGLKTYDIIVEFGGKKVDNSVELMDAVADAKPGVKIGLKIMRQQGDRLKKSGLDITVIERDEKKLATRINPEIESAGKVVPYDLGFKVTDLTAQIKKSLALPVDLKKAVVIEVNPKSPAGAVGLRVGDVLLDINHIEVNSSAEVMRALKKTSNQIKLLRGNKIVVVEIK